MVYPSQIGGKTVLVVDDDPDVRDFLQFAIEAEGYRVNTAGDGIEALDHVRAQHPDVVVLDLNLSHSNGLDACRQITRANPQTKVIMFTALNDPDVRQRSFEVGASAFVSKLAGPGDDLLSTIQRLCAD